MGRLRVAAFTLGLVAFSGSFAFGQAKLGPHVVDSSGQRVGYPIDVGITAVIINGTGYYVELARSGFVAPNVTVYVDQADCTGQKYVRVRPDIQLVEEAWYTTDGHFYYPAVALTAEVITAGITTLNADGTFGPCVAQPGDSLHAAPLLSAPAPTLTPPFLVVDSIPVSPAPAQATFSDVPTNHPFFRFVEALHAAGLSGGCQMSPPLYCPDAPLTRGQIAVFLATALGL